jgi:hypothetical protein
MNEDTADTASRGERGDQGSGAIGNASPPKCLWVILDLLDALEAARERAACCVQRTSAAAARSKWLALWRSTLHSSGGGLTPMAIAWACWRRYYHR